MKCLDLNSDVLAIKCIKNHVFIGVGCTLYVLNNRNFEIKIQINVLHPDNIHGIIMKLDKILVYGEKSLCILDFNINSNSVTIEQIHEIHRFEDWIINVEWLDPLANSILTILFAHNYVYNFELYTKQYFETYCLETCLLYAGAISGQSCKNAIIFSGTIFQEILIWKVTNSKYSEVLHRLKGHKGVILSIFYNPLYHFICSTSDDRTVRLWKISNYLNNNQNIIVWENVKISLQTTMYGHLARVWKAVQLNNIIASIGEDSRICFWSISGELLQKMEAHQGAPIWCIDMSQNDIVFTGGGDGSINSLPLNISSCLQNYVLLEENNDVFPKYISFIDNRDILIYSNCKNSKILHFKKNFELLNSYNLPEYSSTYCIMSVSLNRQIIALASITGYITLHKRIQNIWNQVGKYKILNSKIISIQWLKTDTILISSEEGLLYVLKFSTDNIQIFSKHILPASKERWVTSACVYNNLLICGDRMGSIFIYKLQNNEKNPVQSFKRIHGRLGVQSCIIMKDNLITAGRDGTLRFYKFCDIRNKNLIIEFLHTKTMPMGWVSKLIKNQNNYYVLGFQEEEFIIYSLSLKRILIKIPCGGGHRSWDCMFYNKVINFAYIKRKQACVITIALKKILVPPLMNGIHKKQINCIKILKTLSQHHILVSGSEDCALVISSINFKLQMKLEFVDSFDGHLSSIKCLSIFTLSMNKKMSKHLIFSGGGRAQLKVWEITIRTNRHILSNEDICCKDLLSYMLHGLDKERNKIWLGKEFMYNTDAETRYMDISTIKNPKNISNILVFIACSDGGLRLLSYNIESNKIKLIHTLVYKNRCILKVHSFNHKEKIILLTMATDGLLNIWNVVPINDTAIIKKIEINGNEDFNLHQSGINSFDIQILNSHEYMLATGGDDNLLNLLIFKIILKKNEILSVQIVFLWKTASTHSAQVTGINLLNGNRLISVGTDQKLVIHKYSYSNSKLNVIFLEKMNLCIPDIQGITFCENKMRSEYVFCVYGKGFQILQV